MEFEVSRTSQMGVSEDKPPIPEAVLVEREITVDFDFKGDQPPNFFYANGYDWKHEPGGRSTRKQMRRMWVVNISSLEELMGFVAAVGDNVIVGVSDRFPSLEIYDDYRE